jgi:hypothetical protein
MLAWQPERLGDRVGGDVVMRRPDAAGGEHIGVARPDRVERLDDGVLVVGDDAHFLQVDADRRHHLGQMADIAVLGPPRQDLVADDEHGRCHDVAHLVPFTHCYRPIAPSADAGNRGKPVNEPSPIAHFYRTIAPRT